ncbi:macrophage mannose receptor 1-like isoform X2 [Neocloeon triangulifer]|uniref:macrophage mannose receptor 1-like isoform X2 n=1 Tax=Neocloeon triangulifer TaxID=2078957 RepID=UPI00286F29AF|nr:macrophage mannose receptor 1-like isoform X2 [Neocloeon triangulifer]
MNHCYLCLGICFAVVFWNAVDGAERKVAKVHSKQNTVVIKVNKQSKSTSRNAQRRGMIVKCCGGRKCSMKNHKKKNGTMSRVAKIIRNELNGPSNRLVVIGKKKYKFPPEKATFEEAKKICEDQGLDLTSPASTKETKSIDEYLNYIGLGSEPLFTAFPTDASLSGAKWGSDKPPGGPGECLTQYKGSLYNASCNQQSHFSCQEKPLPEGVTQSYDMLASIGDAVLNFVGGKNIIAPSERASVPEASGMCKEKGMDLMSLDSLTQLSSVQDFLGGIGLSSSTLLTSMKKVDDSGSSNWLGDLASALLPPPKNPADQGDCMGISSLGILGVSCDMVSNFVCQAPPPKLIGDNGNELPFSMDLLNMANSLGIESLLEPESKTTAAKATTQKRGLKTTLPKPGGTTLKRAAALITTTDTVVTDGTLISDVSEIATTPDPTQADLTVMINVGEITTVVVDPTTLAVAPNPVPAAPQNPAAQAPVTTTTTPAPIPFETTFNGRTYYGSNFTLPALNASDWCVNISSRLVLIEDKTEYDMLFNLTGPDSGRENQTFYTGMNKIGRDWSFFVMDDFATAALNSVNSSQCLILTNGTYMIDSCNESRFFICETNKPNATLYGKAWNISLFGNYFTQLFMNYTSYEMVKYCREQKFDTAQVNNSFELLGELKYLIYSLGLQNTPLHISVPKINGTYPLNLPWAKGNPDANLGCVAYFNYSLVSTACTSLLFGICEAKNHSAIASDWRKILQNETYVISGAIFNSIDGKDYCKSLKLEMVSVESYSEHIAIISMLQASNLSNVYVAIDLHKFNATSYVWGNNKTFFPQMVNWIFSLNMSGDCGAYFNNSIVMVDCNIPMSVLCEESRDFGAYDGTNSSNNNSSCPNLNISISKVYNTWESARLDCNRIGMDLITIDSQSKGNCFSAYLQTKSRSQDTFWIGISSIAQSTFTWANDKSSLSYVQWQNGFPTSNKKEACVSSSGGQWKNQMCTDINFYACEQSKNIINTTLKGCPATSSRYTLTRDKKSWPAARLECGKDGMDLVSSETPEEDACVRTFINTTGMEQELVWMSLNFINGTNYDNWANGANLSYHSWHPGDPENYPDEKCAIYWKNAWYDLPCTVATFYLCEGSTI